MILRILSVCFCIVFSAELARADAPKVVADIPPVHALTAKVMEGVGVPELLLDAGASAHDYALRPSEARLLQDAGLVIWVGSELTPWLDGPLDALAPDATRLSLLGVPQTVLLPVRSGARFEAHEHDHDHDHDHEHDDEIGDIDPHAWLDPENAVVWVNAIADALSDLDPENAETYASNAIAAEVDIRAAEARAADLLAEAVGGGFIVFHDAYQYFEAHFGIPAAGAIALHDATAPGAGRLTELQDIAGETEVTCVLSETQFDPGLTMALAEGRALSTGVADPLGTDLVPGPGLYSTLIETLAATISDCVTP